MDEGLDAGRYPALLKDDAGLTEEIFALLAARVVGDPYSDDGSFAATVASLPSGLRAMAATHWLDISLTLDSITWHFGNFGEPHLVAQTEAGLDELGLHDLAGCFREAKELMNPLLANRTEADGDPYEILERKELRAEGDRLDRKAWELHESGTGESLIYEAWTRYTRRNPALVFGE